MPSRPAVPFTRSPSRRWLPAVVLLPLALLGGCDDEDSPTEPGEAIPFATVAQDALSARYVAARRDVVRDRPTWETVWREFYPGTPAPSVSFDSETIVLAVMAPQPCTARVTIEEIRRQDREIVVSLVENPTPESCACIVPVQPFHIVRTQRLDEQVRFDARTGPPAECGAV